MRAEIGKHRTPVATVGGGVGRSATVEQTRDGGAVQIQHGSRLGEYHILLHGSGAESAVPLDAEMRLVDGAALGMEALKRLPEVAHLGTFLSGLVLQTHTGHGHREQVVVAERQRQHRFEGAESGKRNNPVAEDTVMYLLALDNLRQLRLSERVGI